MSGQRYGVFDAALDGERGAYPVLPPPPPRPPRWRGFDLSDLVFAVILGALAGVIASGASAPPADTPPPCPSVQVLDLRHNAKPCTIDPKDHR